MTYYAVKVLRDTTDGRKKTWAAQMLWTRAEAETIANALLAEDSIVFAEVWTCEDKAPHNSRMLDRIER